MDFESTTRREGLACSLKWRTVRGRFDRGSAPEAYRLIEASVRRSSTPGRWVEVHSNGPELLVYLGVGPDGFSVGADVVALLVEWAQARAEGIRRGDPASDPLELIVRYFDARGVYVEQTLLAVPADAVKETVPAGAVTVDTVAGALRTHGIAVRA